MFFLLQMSKVSWYKQRLKALLFKARFADKVEEIKPVRNKLSLLVSLCLGLPDRSEITSAVREPQPSNKPLVKSLRSRLFTFWLAENVEKTTNDLRPRLLCAGGIWKRNNHWGWAGELHYYSYVIIFKKLYSIYKMFSVNTKTKCRLRKSLFEEVFEERRFLDVFQV